MRVSEWIVLGFLLYGAAAAWAFPLDVRARLGLAAINTVTALVVVALGRRSGEGRLLSTLRDWLPCVLILLAYRESGLFLIPDPSHHLDYSFVRWDHLILRNRGVLLLLDVASPWLQRYLELCYFFCYPLVPLGLGALYLAGYASGPGFSRAVGATSPRGEERALAPGATAGSIRSCPTDHFWTAVLLATLACYVLFPFFPLTPPRVLFHDVPGPVVAPLLRRMNFWLLDHYSVQACIFPSGHVAAVTATALAVRRYLPRVGIPFLMVAASVALATVYGRYHYAADAVAGALVGIAAYTIAVLLLRRGTASCAPERLRRAGARRAPTE